MADLSNLFKSPISTNSLSASYLEPKGTSSRISPNGSGHWSIGDLQEKVRCGVRKELSVDSMSAELRVFYNMQKEVVFKKLLLIGAIASILYSCNMEGLELLMMILLFCSQLLSNAVLPINNQTISQTLKRLHYLIYFSSHYSLLKWVSSTSNHAIDWPFTYLAVVSACLHFIIKVYTPFFSISCRSISGEVVKQKKMLRKLSILPKYLINRLRMLKGLGKYLIVVGFIATIIVLLVFSYLNRLTVLIFQPYSILISILTFISLELAFVFLSFVDLGMNQDLKLSMLMRDKIPIFLNLLRLQFTPLNQQIQLECLKCMFIKMQQTPNFLSNETIKSLIYSTYMDIFNQYAVLEMERATSLFMQFNTNARINDKTITLQKSILEDLFIPIRKLKAYFSSEWNMLKLIQLLSNLNFLFLIINKIHEESEQEQVKISQRIVYLVKTMNQRLEQCQERISLTPYTRGELTSISSSNYFEIQGQQTR